MDSFRFESWSWFLLLPVVVAAGIYRRRCRAQASILFSSLADLRGLPITFSQRLRRTMPLAYGVALCLLIAALARPQAGKSESRIFGQGIAIELVLDISGSMEALDFQLEGHDVSRLDAVKHVISDFVRGSREEGLSGRKNDLIGVVAFGGFADSKCPLTMDHGAVVDIVQALDVPKLVYDRKGRPINEQSLQEELATAIGDGVGLGVDRLRNVTAKSKVIVLLTDGDNNAGAVDPREAAAIAEQCGIKLYTIGIGRNGVVPVPRIDEFGHRVLMAAQFRIDEDLLREMARKAGGEYFHASNSEALTRVYQQIDQMETSQFEETKYSEYTELFPWFAVPGVGLALIVGVLQETRFRSLP